MNADAKTDVRPFAEHRTLRRRRSARWQKSGARTIQGKRFEKIGSRYD